MKTNLEEYFKQKISENREFTEEQIEEYLSAIVRLIDAICNKEMWSEFKTIQPEDAQYVIENDLNKKNRKLLESHVAMLSDAMSFPGRWTPTNASVAFDMNGKLVDGTHRFTACARSGVPFKTMVTYNVDSEYCGHHIDAIRPRSISDKLKMLNIPANSSHAQIVTLMVAGIGQSIKTVFPDDKVAELERYNGLIDEIVKLGSMPGIGFSGKAALGRAAYVHGIGKIREFVEYYNMKIPATTPYEQSPQVLRRRLIKWKEDMPRGNPGHEIAKQRRAEEYARVEYAIDKFISGETVSTSRGTDVELFPLVTDTDNQ